MSTTMETMKQNFELDIENIDAVIQITKSEAANDLCVKCYGYSGDLYEMYTTAIAKFFLDLGDGSLYKYLSNFIDDVLKEASTMRVASDHREVL